MPASWCVVTEVPSKLCAIVPAFQARDTLPAVLEGVARWCIPIIVVDDGSNDGTAVWLDQWRMETGSVNARILIKRAVNGGKAAALRDGLSHSSALGFDAAITIDADGQHDPLDGARLIERYQAREGEAIVCGERDPGAPGYPLRNLTGRRLNDLAIRAQTGVAVSDCPCGLRVYPLRVYERVRCVSGRFAWEEEFLTRALWHGCGYERVPIRCIYAPHGHHRSHYRFRRDWPEGIAVNLWLIALALRPPSPTRAALIRCVRQVASALSLRRARDQLVGESPARLHGAASMAIGAIAFGATAAGAIEFAAQVLDGANHGASAGETGFSWRWIATALGAWTLVRLHGSLLLAIGVGVLAGMAEVIAARVMHRVSTPARVGELTPGLSAAVIVVVALLLLVVPSVMALRRRAP